MNSINKQFILAALVAGSIWAFFEVVLGSILSIMMVPIRGFVLTAIATAIIFAVYGFTGRVRMVILTVYVAVLLRIIFTSSLAAGVSLTNGSLAVLLQGLMLTAAIAYIHKAKLTQPVKLGITAGIAIFLSGLLFYIIGVRFDPCSWLAGLSFSHFLFHEAVPWAVFSGITAPVGFYIGNKIAQHQPPFAFKPLSRVIIFICWLSCGLTAWLSA